MQYIFSLNNFGVCSSAFNPGDGASEVVLWLSHQRGKNWKKQNKTKPHKTKNPHKLSQVQMQHSFSKFFSMQV
jgi:hypothetical protein